MENFAISERPTCINDVFGNEKIKTILKTAIETNSLPHSIMFVGEGGCGKTSLCNALCHELGVDEINVHYIDLGMYASIDSVRELGEQIKYAPLGGGKCVYILEECHKLSSNKKAQEAFLFLLEHIPEHAYIFATTTNPEQLLKPFLSRFEPLLKVEPLNKDETFNLIRTVSKKYDITLKKSTAERIYEVSDGKPRVALRILYSIKDVPVEEQYDAIQSNEFEEVPEMIELYEMLVRKPNTDTYKTVMETLDKMGQDWESHRLGLIAIAGNCAMRVINPTNLTKGATLILSLTIPCPAGIAGRAMFASQLWLYILQNK